MTHISSTHFVCSNSNHTSMYLINCGCFKNQTLENVVSLLHKDGFRTASSWHSRVVHSYQNTKVIFFWDPSQEMSSSGFPPKNTGLRLANLSGQPILERPVFFWRETTQTHVLTWISEKTDSRLFTDVIFDIACLSLMSTLLTKQVVLLLNCITMISQEIKNTLWVIK